MFGVPHTWRVEPGGKLVHARETEEFHAAVGFVRDLFAAGVYHPNSGNYGALAIKDDHVAGKFAFAESTWTATYPDFWHRGAALDPPVQMRIMLPFTHDGNGSVKYYLSPAVQIGFPLLGITVLKKRAARADSRVAGRPRLSGGAIRESGGAPDRLRGRRRRL